MAEILNGITVDAPSTSTIIAVILAGALLLAFDFASASEITSFSLSPSDLSDIDKHNHPADEKVSILPRDSRRLPATILITNNFVNVTIIMLCNFFFMNVFVFHSSLAKLIILTIVLTFPLLLFGRIMSKIHSVQKTLAFYRFFVPDVYFLEKLFYLVASMPVHSTTFPNKHFAKKNHNISVDELFHALELMDKAEISEENNILEGVIRFSGETVKEMMISHLDMVDLDVRTPSKGVMQCVIESAYLRIPIYSDSRDDIEGVLYIKDLLPHVNKGDNFRWQSLIHPAYFAPETKMIDDLPRNFQANKIRITTVVDEFGGTPELVTMENTIEGIVGEIHDGYDDEKRTYIVLSDHIWAFEVKAQLTNSYKTAKVDEDELGKVVGGADMLADILLETKGEFSVLREKVIYHDYEFEVLEMDSRRILRVKLMILPREMDESESEG